uniref:tRNA pseudouridine synthase A n=1 Tax=Erigeron canadensis TaxID=72917 RepID=UPI001CB9AFA6|nr:tRNA pseudouridine synthase A [Erigeron canadensis]XP_043621809.1 tRNA pseudouridine synthase A [Erigeron canadensis]
MISAYRRQSAVVLELQSQIPKTKLLSTMEVKIPQTKKDFLHYNHTDSCKSARWTSRESYVFMYARPWEKVVNLYSNVVNGHTTLLQLFGSPKAHQGQYDNDIELSEEPEFVVTASQKRAGRWARMNFKIVLSYHGGSFDGWQKQPGLNTVQEVIEKSLGKFVDERKAGVLRDKGLPLEANVVVAGRTDKGVTGFKQVCSFYTWREDVGPQDIEDAISSTVPGKLRVVSVSKVPRTFHPNFSAKWRRYLYIFPLNDGEVEEDATICYNEKFSDQNNVHDDIINEESLESGVDDGKDDPDGIKKPTRFRVSKVNKLLQQLEGKLLSYKMFARDTKPSRNTGPPTECFIFHARATQVTFTIDSEKGEYSEAMCIELVANRFLRKMVRVLVATSIREAAAGAEDDSLIKLLDATCRRATAPPAPPDGLCLVDVGYNEFDLRTCLIL